MSRLRPLITILCTQDLLPLGAESFIHDFVPAPPRTGTNRCRRDADRVCRGPLLRVR